jgi:hypothetical protein
MTMTLSYSVFLPPPQHPPFVSFDEFSNFPFLSTTNNQLRPHISCGPLYPYQSWCVSFLTFVTENHGIKFRGSGH